MIAEIFHALLAEPADAASISEPGDSNSITDLMVRHAAADKVDAADDFVARNDRIFDAGKLRVDHVEIGSANPARTHLDANLPLTGDRVRALFHLERRPRGGQHHRTHLLLQGILHVEQDNA
jgi:hypothetical protein